MNKSTGFLAESWQGMSSGKRWRLLKGLVIEGARKGASSSFGAYKFAYVGLKQRANTDKNERKPRSHQNKMEDKFGSQMALILNERSWIPAAPLKNLNPCVFEHVFVASAGMTTSAKNGRCGEITDRFPIQLSRHPTH